MADYYPLLSKALAGIAPGDSEARERLFDRARQALLTQLRSMEPPLSETDITRQRLALEEAIRRADEDTSAAARASAEAASGSISAPPASRPPLPPAPPADRLAIRPRVEPKERKPRSKLSPPKIGLLLLPFILAMAGAAYYLNQVRRPPEEAVLRPAPPVQRANPNAPKTAERLGGTPGAVQPAPAAPPQPRPVQSQRAAPPPAAAQPPPQQQASAPVQPPPAALPVLVAQRAFLFEEPSGGAQTVNTSAGTVAWLLDSAAGGPGQPLESVIRARIEIPLAQLRAEITIRRNTDAALPASHTIETGFLPAREGGTGPVREIGLFEMRETDTDTGVALLGPPPVFVAENLFLIGLSSSEAVKARNAAMLSGRDWIFFELRFASGRRGALLFEKGAAGRQVFEDALQRWK